jgi:hypothetical protein
MNFENLSVNPASLPDMVQAEFHSHPLRFRSKRLMVATIFLVLLLSGPFVLYLTVHPYVGGLSAVVWSLVAAFLLLTIFKDFPRRAYALRQRDITYRKGWIFHSITSVPFNRIQHTEINQGPLDRAFNLASLSIYTAGGSASDLVIPGLPYEEAQRLREFIAKKSAQDA